MSLLLISVFFFFFFKAEDGIRDYKVTGVQTCALPIWEDQAFRASTALRRVRKGATPPRVAPAGGGERRDGAGAGKAGPRVLDLPRRRVCAGSAQTARDPAGAQREGGGADARPPSRVDGPRFA